MSKLITLEQLKTFASNIKNLINGKSRVINGTTFGVKLQLPCYCTVVGKAGAGDNILNSIICIQEGGSGIVINSGKIQITKVSRNGNVFKMECSEQVYYVTSSSELTSNPSSSTELKEIQFIDNIITESAPVQSDVSFSIRDANGSTQTYPQIDYFTSIYEADHLTHNITFRLADSGVNENGYNLSGSEVLIQSSIDSTVASQDTLGKIKVDGEFGSDATKLPVKLENDYAYVTLPTSIFTYKGFVDSYEDLPTDAKEGDVYTVKNGTDPEDVGSEYVRVKKDDSYYWEYVGQKVKFEGYHYTNSTPMPDAVGGLAKGTTFDKMELDQVLDKLLYPYVKFSWSVSANPSTFEYGTTPKSISFKATVTKGSKDYTITPASGTYTLTPTATLTTNQSYQFTVTDGSTTENKTATSSVGYCVKLFYSSIALASLTENDIPNDTLWTKNASNQSVSATSTSKQNLYFVCPKAWWEDGKTLSSKVGPVFAGATREITRNTCPYTVAYLGQFTGTSSYTVNNS